MTYKQRVGREIAEARRRLPDEPSQEALARRLGISANTVGNWERGTFLPAGDQVLRLCRVLGLEPNDLFGWDADDTTEDDR